MEFPKINQLKNLFEQENISISLEYELMKINSYSKIEDDEFLDDRDALARIDVGSQLVIK